MVGAVTGFLQGRQLRQQEEEQKFQMEERLEARNMRQAQKRKAERFQGALGELYQGTPYEGMAEFGTEGIQAVGQLQTYESQQSQALKDKAIQDMANALPFAFGIGS